eukprot:13257070-Alexandrium_andersonii.AAC.1
MWRSAVARRWRAICKGWPPKTKGPTPISRPSRAYLCRRESCVSGAQGRRARSAAAPSSACTWDVTAGA